MTAVDRDAVVIPEGFDFTDPFINEEAIPHQEFLALRQTAPVTWVEQAPGPSTACPRSPAAATSR